METRILLIVLIVLASGCSQLPTDNSPVDTAPPPGKGLEIVRFDVADKTMTPNQESLIILRLKNYHTKRVSIDDMSLYNTGLLDTEKRGCSPSTLERAREGIFPEMECTWRVVAPSSEEIGAFETKPQSLNLHLEYQSSLTNNRPLQLQFKPLSEINSTQTKSISFSNGEARGTMEVESPATFSGRLVDFKVESVGPGRVLSDYTFEYAPSELFVGCPSSKEPVVNQRVEFTCNVQDDQEVVRNLHFSTYYKYVKEPTLDIQLVNK